MRLLGDGELAGIYSARATVVKSDDLADFYSNRPVAKMFHVLDQMGDYFGLR